VKEKKRDIERKRKKLIEFINGDACKTKILGPGKREDLNLRGFTKIIEKRNQ
jgi:hypothetical protein